MLKAQILNNYLKNIWLILLNFLEGLIAGFISIIIASGWAAFFYGEWNRFSISFISGAIIGFFIFLTLLAGLPVFWFK